MAAEFGRPPEPTPISRTHYIDPCPEINAAFEETNAQARKEQENKRRPEVRLGICNL